MFTTPRKAISKYRRHPILGSPIKWLGLAGSSVESIEAGPSASGAPTKAVPVSPVSPQPKADSAHRRAAPNLPTSRRARTTKATASPVKPKPMNISLVAQEAREFLETSPVKPDNADLIFLEEITKLGIQQANARLFDDARKRANNAPHLDDFFGVRNARILAERKEEEDQRKFAEECRKAEEERNLQREEERRKEVEREEELSRQRNPFLNPPPYFPTLSRSGRVSGGGPIRTCLGSRRPFQFQTSPYNTTRFEVRGFTMGKNQVEIQAIQPRRGKEDAAAAALAEAGKAIRRGKIEEQEREIRRRKAEEAHAREQEARRQQEEMRHQQELQERLRQQEEIRNQQELQERLRQQMRRIYLAQHDQLRAQGEQLNHDYEHLGRMKEAFANEARVIEETFRQQEYFRKESEPTLPRDLSTGAIYATYESRWNEIGHAPEHSLGFVNIPWPVTKLIDNVGALADEALMSFLINELRTGLEGKSLKARAKAEIMRWHPDKFAQFFGSKIHESEIYAVSEGVDTVARFLTAIISGAIVA